MNLRSPGLRILSAAALLLAAGIAHAQYVWVDDKGIKQFSDRSPPSSVPEKNILKAPGRQQTLIVAAGQEPAVPAAGAAKKAPATVAERNVDFNKRASEKAEQDKKAAAQAQSKAAKAEQCAAARDYKAQLDSGVRIGTVGKGGERGFMGDSERAAANAKVNRSLADCR